MNLLPQKDYTILGTTSLVVLRAWSMLQIELAKLRRDACEAEGKTYDGIEELRDQILNKTTGEPVWATVEAMKAALSMGQMAALSEEISALTFGGQATAKFFRGPGEEVADADPSPNGEGVRGPAVVHPEG